jgi:hypothetical protein
MGKLINYRENTIWSEINEKKLRSKIRWISQISLIEIADVTPRSTFGFMRLYIKTKMCAVPQRKK